MKINVKIVKTQKSVLVERRGLRVYGVRQSMRFDFIVGGKAPDFSRSFLLAEASDAPFDARFRTDRGFSASKNRCFPRPRVRRLAKFWRIDGNSRTNEIVRQRVATKPNERFGRFSAVETIETKNDARRRRGEGLANASIVLMAKTKERRVERTSTPEETRRLLRAKTTRTSSGTGGLTRENVRSFSGESMLNFNDCNDFDSFNVKRGGAKRRKSRVFAAFRGFRKISEVFLKAASRLFRY